ncbi:MAG: molybdate ABC transporter permease subunit [Betaproteobacteria bacterium]|nr:molybdate ABC transporter permease subunit [Betaproteobacteria bacterium]NDF03597.1 molybdate ABC transporter permease subunit [Betaproteobacteria bacterium]
MPSCFKRDETSPARRVCFAIFSRTRPERSFAPSVTSADSTVSGPIDQGAWQAIGLTLQLAALTTIILLLLATPVAWWLSQTHSRWRGVVSALVAMPLVLPPTVLGFYLLVLLGPQGWVGQLTQALGLGVLSFSFSGLVFGSVVFSLPFAVQPIQYAFEAIGRRPMEVAATLRARPIDAFFSVALPLAKPGLLTATVLTFSHTVGEFGVALMVGGNIPGQTRVVSTQIYGHVEAMEYTQAHWLAAGMVMFSFLVLLSLTRLKTRVDRVMP